MDLTFIKGLFGNIDSLTSLKEKSEIIPLKKNGDIEHELKIQTSEIEKSGHKVLSKDQNRYGEFVLISRLFYGDGMDDSAITLKIRVITDRGIRLPDSRVHLIVHQETYHLEIADIRIEGDRVNRGYGSMVMKVIMELVDELRIKHISGWISGVDWDHIERSEYFYRKHGFECELNHDEMTGTINWRKNA